MAGKLRHGLNYLCVSDIAEQFYCEQKVHLKRLHPEVQIELPALSQGEANHTALAGQSLPITAAQIEQSVKAGKRLAICEWPMNGCLHDVEIHGRPDVFVFEGNNAHLLLDFKFSGAKEPFRDQEVQAEIYGLLAESIGFSTHRLCLGIVIFPPAGLASSLRGAALTKETMLQVFAADGTLRGIYERCKQASEGLVANGAKKTRIETERWKAFLFRHDPKRAERELTCALGYWLNEREPIPVKRWPRKCVACPMNAAARCEHALMKPDPNLKVEQRPDGRILVYR